MDPILERYHALEKKVAAYTPNLDAQRLYDAFTFADAEHHGQLRKSGEPYIIHPLAVADIVADLGLDTDSVIAALLPALRASTREGGVASIVGVTSIAAHRAYEGGGGYNATKHAQRAVLEVLRLELSGEPIRVVEVAPGMVHTEEFSLKRFGGDRAKADAVYENVPAPLVAEDIAEVIVHAVELPPHVDLDSITVKPVAQAAPHKVARGELRAKA